MSKRKTNKVNKFGEKLTPTASRSTTSGSQMSSQEPLLFKKQNYMLILGGFALICIGYLLMSGGSMPDSNTFDPDIIYSTRRTLIAPIFILAGLGLEIYAVFKK